MPRPASNAEKTPARAVLVGGAPLAGPRYIEWNFVSSTRERIERAKDDWRAQRFPIVPGDELERIPLPEQREKWMDGLFDRAAIKRNL